ncbi:MAG: hypothetical protein LUE88_00970 [Clostridiales bacterium]|nr:hypothetical protein [Clostridiales bacterium]
MKKKLALLMAAIMTVAMVPMTAFAATSLTVAKNLSVGVGDDYVFDALVELENSNSTVGTDEPFVITLTLTNGKFAKADGVQTKEGGDVLEDEYIMNDYRYIDYEEIYVNEDGDYVTTATDDYVNFGNGYKDDLDVAATEEVDDGAGGTTTVVTEAVVTSINVLSATKAEITVSRFQAGDVVVIPIKAYAVEEGEVKATFYSNKTVTFTKTDAIAIAYSGDVVVESDGVVTFVEDSSSIYKEMEPITITGLYAGALTGDSITLKLKGNYKFVTTTASSVTILSYDGKNGIYTDDVITFLNDDGIEVDGIISGNSSVSDNEIVFEFTGDIDLSQVAEIYISGIYITPTKSCDAGDVAKLIISSDDFSKVTLEVAKMVEEAVTYSVEDDDLPTIWAGKDYADEDTYTLKVYIEENTGDILNTSRKATFTFPDGIEVVDIVTSGLSKNGSFTYQIDENVVTIWNYGETGESDATDMSIKFIINAAPTYEGDVEVTLGGEFDDVEFTVATVKAPYTIEAKTSEVLIDYRYVPVNEIVITEAEEEIFAEGDTIILQVEKMDFEDAGTYEVTEGDIEVDVNIDTDDDVAQLTIEVTEESTEASTIVISGLELYLDRTLPVGGYALENIGAWSNSKGVNSAINIL